jgi:hypothetical protein
MPSRTQLTTTLEGGYGWRCPVCAAESRYLYRSRTKAKRLGIVHERHCRGRRQPREVRR